MSEENVRVAVNGAIDRCDTCGGCGSPMLYRVDDHERVTESFCGNSRCPAFLIEIAEAHR